MTGILWGVVGVLLAVVWIVTIVDVVRRHLGMGRTAAWICLIVIFPFLGSILYWALRKPSAEEVQRQVDAEAELRRASRPPYDAGPI